MKRNLEIVPISNVDQLLEHALVEKLTPIEWMEPAEVESVAGGKGDEEHGGLVTH